MPDEVETTLVVYRPDGTRETYDSEQIAAGVRIGPEDKVFIATEKRVNLAAGIKVTSLDA